MPTPGVVLRWIKANHKTEVAREEMRVEALGKRHDADQVQTIIDSWCGLDGCESGRFLLQADMPGAGT